MTQRAPDPDENGAPRPADPLPWVVLASALLFLALAWPALMGRAYAGNDLDRFHLPLRWFYAKALEAGQNFDWMPSLFSGFYLTGEGQAGTYHPLHRLLYGWLPLVAAFDLEVLSSYVFLFAGTWFLLRRPLATDSEAGLPPAAALFGAMLFTFSTSTMLHFIHPNAIAVVAHLPWNLAAIDEALRPSGPAPHARRRLVALLALAALTASMLLCGYPQYVWIVACAEAAWALLALAPPFLARDAAAAAAVVAAKALGAAMAAVQLLPTWEHLQGATRHVLAQDLSAAGSLHPLNLVQLVAPYLFDRRTLGDHPHEYGVYAGAVPLLLVTWRVLSLREAPSTRRERGLAILGVVALVLAFGRYVGSDRLQAMLPVVGDFRFPARFLFLFHFAIAVVAAEALARLAGPTRRTATHFGHPGWILVVCSVMFASLLALANAPLALGAVPLVAAGPLLFTSAAWLLGLALRGRRFALSALVLLAAFDAGSYGLTAWAWPCSRPFAAILAEVPQPPRHDARVATLQPEALGRYIGDRLVMKDAELFDGYAGLPQATQPSPATVEHLRLAAVDYVLRTPGKVPEPGLLQRDDDWLAVPAPRPRVRLATRSIVTDDAAKALRELSRSTPAATDDSVVFTSRHFDLAGPRGRILSTSREPGRIRARVEAPTPQMLVVAERFHQGWNASVNGRGEDVREVDGSLLGTMVGPGLSEVEFVFAPRGLARGRVISLAALAVWSLLLLGAGCIRPFGARPPRHGARQ